MKCRTKLMPKTSAPPAFVQTDVVPFVLRHGRRPAAFCFRVSHFLSRPIKLSLSLFHYPKPRTLPSLPHLAMRSPLFLVLSLFALLPPNIATIPGWSAFFRHAQSPGLRN